MVLFRTQLLQEAPRHVAGPYTGTYSRRRYGRRDAARTPPVPPPCLSIARDFDALRQAECEVLHRMCDYDIAA